MTSTAAVLADPEWLPHRYDEAADAFRFVHVPRAKHRAVTFLTDEHLADTDRFVAVPRTDIDKRGLTAAPLHFVIHSAYCCSTLVARMFDLPAVSMGLKEPQVLNDLVGWRQRGADPNRLAAVLDVTLALLSRPFGAGEAVVVKPSNIVNSLAPAMLGLRSNARMIQLYAPARDYLASIAVKGLWGRQWVRKVLLMQAREQALTHPFGAEELIELTDLQAAGLGWLSNHGIFAQMRARFGEERVAICDSRTLLQDREATVRASYAHLGIEIDASQVAEVAAGEAFTTNSKDRSAYSSEDRDAVQRRARDAHGEEIDMVATWVEALARDAGIDAAPQGLLTG